MTLNDIRNLIHDDLAATDALILQRLTSDVVLINQIGHYIVHSGGKRLRPLLLLLSANLCGVPNRHHHTLAAVIEFIHTSTLLHDDVVDASTTRRGRDTANQVWGNAASVLVGDFLYSRSFEMMVEPGDMRVMEILSQATNVIAEGEVLQLLNCHNAEVTVDAYMEVIHRKTAKLFEAATQLGSVLGKKPEWEDALASYGLHVGTAFQLIDDVLDYSADRETLGKNIGDDLAEGKPTLPLIYLIEQGTETQVAVVKQAIEKGDTSQLSAITEMLHQSGALKDTRLQAEKQAALAKTALHPLPDSPFKQALIALADLSVARDH